MPRQGHLYVFCLWEIIFSTPFHMVNIIFAERHMKSKLVVINILIFSNYSFFTAWEISLKACPWTLIFFLHDPSSSTFRKYSQSVSWFGAPNFKASPWSSRPSSFCPSLAREVSLFSTQSYQIIVSFACRPCRAMRASREMEIQVCNYCKVYSQEIWVIN